MSIIYNDRVYVGDVYSALNNIGANKHIVFAVNEIKNSLFEVVALHLAMCIAYAEIGTKPLDHIYNFRQTTDSIVHEKNLSASFSLEIDRVANDVFIVYLHFGFYRLSVRWWSVDDAKVPCTH